MSKRPAEKPIHLRGRRITIDGACPDMADKESIWFLVRNSQPDGKRLSLSFFPDVTDDGIVPTRSAMEGGGSQLGRVAVVAVLQQRRAHDHRVSVRFLHETETSFSAAAFLALDEFEERMGWNALTGT
jgi:hypothetical protein